MELSLSFEPNETGHDDIVLRFAGAVYRADSYYLAIDTDLEPDREDDAKARAVFNRLLEQWRDAIRRLGPGEAVCLPYDFSDQYTAWLRCERDPQSSILKVERGWAPLEGYYFCPSNLGSSLPTPEGFIVDGPSAVSPIADVLDAIEGSLKRSVVQPP